LKSILFEDIQDGVILLNVELRYTSVWRKILPKAG
jgi:hypothetical protein